MRQIVGGVFFGKGEILVKLRFEGLNYHSFHIFDHNYIHNKQISK